MFLFVGTADTFQNETCKSKNETENENFGDHTSKG